MTEILNQPILLITIVPLDGGREQERDTKGTAKADLRESSNTPSDIQHWQIEEFL